MQKAFLSEPITSCKDGNDTIPALIFCTRLKGMLTVLILVSIRKSVVNAWKWWGMCWVIIWELARLTYYWLPPLSKWAQVTLGFYWCQVEISLPTKFFSTLPRLLSKKCDKKVVVEFWCLKLEIHTIYLHLRTRYV